MRKNPVKARKGPTINTSEARRSHGKKPAHFPTLKAHPFAAARAASFKNRFGKRAADKMLAVVPSP